MANRLKCKVYTAPIVDKHSETAVLKTDKRSEIKSFDSNVIASQNQQETFILSKNSTIRPKIETYKQDVLHFVLISPIAYKLVLFKDFHEEINRSCGIFSPGTTCSVTDKKVEP